MKRYDAVVVGGGPNGLSAAIVLAQRGVSVLLLEANSTLGGGARSAELTLPGFVHDICSAIHPFGVLSPVFRQLKLEIEWVWSRYELAHPFDDGTAGILDRSVDATADRLESSEYRRSMTPWLESAGMLFDEILRPIRVPRHPLLLARFGLSGLRSAISFARRLETHQARAVFAGCAAHSILPLTYAATASFGITLALSAHAAGWPCARGGSSRITEALVSRLRLLGGQIETGTPVRSLRDLPAARAVLFDLSPRQVLSIAGDGLPASYKEKLSRFRYGPGVFKIDWALDGPIPWRAPDCASALTVHLGGSLDEIALGEAAVWRGEHPAKPFVILAQPSLYDSSRAPDGKHTAWAYCHVPNGSTVDMTTRIEEQVERFAPGFRDRVLARHTMTTRQFQEHNENVIGGDIGGGANNFAQILARPVLRFDPYSTPNRRIFLCSSSTPPGGGVHGMCGYWAARSVLRHALGADE